MIRDCRPDEFDAMLAIINDGAQAYRGVIPADRSSVMHDTVRSQRGVLITKRTTGVMRRFLETIKREGGSTISFAVTRQPDGTLYISLGGDYDAQPGAIADEVEEITFYWYTEAPEFAELEKYIVDSPGDGPTQLIAIEDDG